MSWRSKLVKSVMGVAVIEVVDAEVPKFHDKFFVDRPQYLVELAHTHQEFNGRFGEFATAAVATTSTGSHVVSAGSPFGLTPRFGPLKRI